MEQLTTSTIGYMIIAGLITTIVTVLVTKYLGRGDKPQEELDKQRDKREEEMFSMIKEIKLMVDNSFTQIQIHASNHKRYDQRFKEIESDIKQLNTDAIRLREDLLKNKIQL